MNFKFPVSNCSICNKNKTLMFSNNPLVTSSVCFDCIKEKLDYNNLQQADFFCRTYNLPFLPDLFITLSEQYKGDVWQQYTQAILDDPAYAPNLYYSSSTRDMWARANKEWEKKRSFAEILASLDSIRESYITRARLKWGQQYTFEQLIKLDDIYSKTLKANRIINPLQKEAVKTLCKLQIEIDEAIQNKDTKAMRDFSNAWSTFSKQADLETMINETKTDDITTVSELYDYMEKAGFQFKFYDGFPRDEVDQALADISASNKRLILEATGLEQQLSDMIRQRQETLESSRTAAIAEEDPLPSSTTISQDLTSATTIEQQDDDAVLDTNWEDQV